jgi:hypothetical protein
MPPRKPQPRPVRAIALALSELDWAATAATERGDEIAAREWRAVATPLGRAFAAAQRVANLEARRPPVP